MINKTDLAPYVGANLEIMRQDTLNMRKERPFVMTDLHKLDGLNEVIEFIKDKGMLA